MTSVGTDGPGRVHECQQAPVLHRASTISGVPAPSVPQAHHQRIEREASVCCSGGVKRAHSVHLCADTGLCHHSQCEKEHLSQKLVQGLRRKLSFLHKRRVKSSEIQAPRHRGRGVSQWLRDASGKSPTSSSKYTQDFENEYQAQPNSILASEVHGDHFFTAAELSSHAPSSRTPTRTETAYSELLISRAFELREACTLPPTEPKVPRRCVQSRAESLHKTSAVSALSSFDMSVSDGQWSNQISQCSVGFNSTPATSMSESGFEYTAIPLQLTSSARKPPRRQLKLDTHLTVPQGLVMDGPLTDSPTAGDDDEFAGLRVDGDQVPDPSGPNEGINGLCVLAELEAEVPQMPSWLPVLPLLTPEEVAISSPVSPKSPREDCRSPTSTDLCCPPTYTANDHYQTPDDTLAARVLASCHQFASSISIQSQSSLLTLLEDLFDAPVSYYLAKAKHSPKASGYKLAKTWEVSPTVEAALIGMHRLEAGGNPPTSYQLVSLGFFSLSLVCLAIDDKHDLETAVQRLHGHSRALSTMIDDPEEKQAFESLVDDLWLFAEGGHYPGQLLEVAQGHSFSVNATQHGMLLCNNLVVQIAQVFVMCKSTYAQR